MVLAAASPQADPPSATNTESISASPRPQTLRPPVRFVPIPFPPFWMAVPVQPQPSSQPAPMAPAGEAVASPQPAPIATAAPTPVTPPDPAQSLAPTAAESLPEAEQTTAGSMPPRESVPKTAEAVPAEKKMAPQTTGRKHTANPKKSVTSKSKKRRLCWQDGKLEVCEK
jgi:hypothetical protein